MGPGFAPEINRAFVAWRGTSQPAWQMMEYRSAGRDPQVWHRSAGSARHSEGRRMDRYSLALARFPSRNPVTRELYDGIRGELRVSQTPRTRRLSYKVLGYTWTGRGFCLSIVNILIAVVGELSGHGSAASWISWPVGSLAYPMMVFGGMLGLRSLIARFELRGGRERVPFSEYPLLVD
jgi:hypothetical protein